MKLKLLFVGIFLTLSAKVFSQYNYGEALQKSLLFYETQQSGILPDWNRISWRGDSGVNDGQDVGLDLTGGWHDAGDHIKFGFPMAFSVTALNWGYLEYKEGYDNTNQTEIFKRNIKWVTDYFIKCHPSPNEFYVQISEKGQDHNYWMPAEMVDVHPMYGVRKAHKLTPSNPGTEVSCETAAALASASMVFKDSDPAYSATLLQHAKELFEFGDTNRGSYHTDGGTPVGPTYPAGPYEDEVVWGALWLYQATGEQKYLDKAEAEYAQPDFLWSLVWDDKSYGNMILLAILTGKDQYKIDSERHLDFWQPGGGINYSPGGQAHLFQWGSLRHSMNAALTALIYSDNVATSKKQQYHDFAVDQIKYALGDNPINRSYVTGFGNNPPTKIHHRGQHSSWRRSEAIPVESRHTLWGALIGGPNSADDGYDEDRSDFQENEVATDYNACYQGVLARMIMEFGGTPLANFPQPEVPGPEFMNEVKINSTSSKFTEVAIWLNNRSAWPARVPNTLTARYFINISEGVAAGLSPSDYQITARGAGNVVGGLQAWDASSNIYYVEVAVDQDKMPFPGGQGEYRSEIQMRVGIPNTADESAWDATNDFSRTGINNTLKIVDNVPIYADGKLVGGKEPNGGDTPTASFTATPKTGIAPLEVQFDASASSDPNGDNLTYSWDFGNGTTSTLVNPKATYTAVGDYVVTLTVSDGTNTSSPVTETIQVTDGSPIASFTASTESGAAPLSVQFDASASSDPAGGTLTYSWDLGNGQSANTVTTSASYDIGTYTVTLTVTNAAGQTDVTTKTITAADGNVSCAFGAPTAEALPSIDNTQYTNIFVLGNGGPNLDNITMFTINWDLANSGLYQFAINTNNGTPNWYVDLRSVSTQNFNSAQPSITFTNSGISGLDGAYWATVDKGNFALVSQTGGYTIYFSTSATKPDCGTISTPVVDGGTISGGPFTFTVGDGIVDNVSGITLTGNVGANSTWVVTDAQSNILGLPATLTALEGVDFDTAGDGTCLIWHLSFEDGLQGAVVGNNASDLVGTFDLSNSIEVIRNPFVNPPVVDGGTISGGPFTFTVGDGIVDNVSGITLTGNVGTNSTWVVTDAQSNILGLPATLTALEGVDFDTAGDGTCLIWHLSFEDGLQGAAVGNNASDLVGTFDLSNSIEVIRNPFVNPVVDGGTISGGPFTFTVGDGIVDNVSGITLTGNVGANSTWVVTDAQSNILGLPATLTALEGVDFDTAGDGSCFIWHLSFEDGLQGAAVGNNVSSLAGTFDLSNSIEVIRNQVSTGGDCKFGTPSSDALPSVNQAYENIYVLGSGGPNLDNVTNLTINWDLGNNGLYQLSMSTNNGTPNWYNDLKSKVTQNFNSAQPAITIAGSGFPGLDGAYDVTLDQGNLVLVSKTAAYTLYFSTSATAPNCDGGSGGNNNPIAEFTATPPTGQIPLTVTFDASASSDPDGDTLTYSWDFGDGNTGTGVTVDNTFTTEGNIPVVLTVSDGNGGEAQKTIVIRATDTPIIVDPDPTGNVYLDRFNELRAEFYAPENGYFSADGSPHHSIESLIVEAPDHGHESTSELYSYWLWLEVMNGRVNKDWSKLSDVWDKIEQFIIPTKADQPTNAAYNPSSPAAYAPEFALPSGYPAPLEFSAPVGVDPVSAELTAAYGPEVYQMHWLLDNDNFYGYGNRGDGVSTPSYINTFQRGEQESVYETIPHPSWEGFDWGGADGYLPLFTIDQNYSRQWRYTSATDADARAVQAMYWAQVYAKEQNISLNVLDLDKATKMGDYLRIGMFDKYFKPLGVQSETTGAGTGYDSAHYLMSWYISWGGAVDTSAPWAFRISSSHCHFGYQNPVAAYAMSQVDELKPATPNGARDWGVSLQRQLEFYTWLQSKEGGIAGGATNSWNGDYSTYPAGKSTFYDMAFDTNPVYEDPGSGTWFGWQAWSMERIAEYYYITNDAMAKNLMDKWANWVKNVVILIGDDDFDIPATLEWTGEPDTWDPNNPGSNSGLSVTVTDYGKDLGVAASMAKALIYYAAATEKYETLDTASRDLAKEVLDRMWVTYRDDKGVSAPESRGDFSRMFEQEVFVPSGFSGTMPNGDVIEPGVTFLDIRSNYRNDPDFARLEEAYNTGQEYTQRYHRSWAQIEVALANAEYGFFFGDNQTTTNQPAVKRMVVGVGPNPTKDMLNVSVSNNENKVELKLIDLSGRVVGTQQLESAQQSTVMSVKGLPVGIYILQTKDIASSAIISRKKIIVTK
ncbi:glycoside hydrolase family 48 protein [Tenacibaculum agarivorans]|uniref:glycoside hydrolase family 48 protein n=1 Tax=Tenacibaculum agarivorans TaxID=1908389 RepID=UPI00094BC3E2|nr:glycoside hydrolase family 48 protein [Tenacibaculum agarivorans]